MSLRHGSFIPRVSAHSQRDLFAWSLLVALILLSLLARPFFSGGLYTTGDLGKFQLPARAFYADQLARGESFDWMPSVYSGFYLTGDGQVGPYHPLHLVLYGFLPLRTALGWDYLCSYPLMLAGMYWFLLRLLRRKDAAMVGGLAFTFSSFSLLHFVQPSAVAAVAHIPWMLAMIDIVIVDAQRWKVALAEAALALLTGSQLLLGCPQYVWFSLLTEAGFTIYLISTRRFLARDDCETMPTCQSCIGCRRNSALRIVVAKAVGLLVGAIQLFPTLEALWQSLPATAAPDTLHPVNLIQLVAPYLPLERVFGGNTPDLGLYVGAVPLMLALSVAVRRQELGGLKRLAQATAVLAGAALLLAMGSQLRCFAAQDSLPWAVRFFFSCRYTVLFQFAVAVLAAIGFTLVERDAREKYKLRRHLPLLLGKGRPTALWRHYEILGATVLASVAVAAAGLILQAGHQVAPVSRVVVGPLLMAAAALMLIAAAQGVRGALVGLILFMAADLGYYGLSCIWDESIAQPDGLAALFVAPPGTASSAATDGQRVFAPPVATGVGVVSIGNEMILAGWSRTDGYAGLAPSKLLDYCQLPALRVASTGWVHRDTATSRVEGLAPCDANWLRVPDPLPLVRMVTHVVPSDDPARDLAKIDVCREALCENALALPPGKPGTATLTQSGAGRMIVKVCCSTPQLLVIAESYHPGWRCTIDGSPSDVYRVNGDFLGCRVEPGSSDVHLEFRPESLSRGRIISWTGLGLICLCLASGFARRESGLVEKIRRRDLV